MLKAYIKDANQWAGRQPTLQKSSDLVFNSIIAKTVVTTDAHHSILELVMEFIYFAGLVPSLRFSPIIK